ncbi:hypothetical protein [Holdemania massiliensis]|uniref:Uncharacterized protein n=1 Tax=Holdemania massiliensis TaxID=1468449 RepID=A0A6N7S6T8_9FIRM|nr:hypothetical protein [Holdemania massiliensis]MSA71331.1 hypothetical protein [Holdemania massiliensis]MSA89238.1 hypothetical protein [Holdemania massiliensis]MSB78411.1 hypothetical protein [Holdemania massiliensis]MSC33335.1 hypothetical protein [Holdemania massiliensis]MSC39313.1 hypothetical protein [Holdemania massiliensis]
MKWSDYKKVTWNDVRQLNWEDLLKDPMSLYHYITENDIDISDEALETLKKLCDNMIRRYKLDIKYQTGKSSKKEKLEIITLVVTVLAEISTLSANMLEIAPAIKEFCLKVFSIIFRRQ